MPLMSAVALRMGCAVTLIAGLAACAGTAAPEYYTLVHPLEKTADAAAQPASILLQMGAVQVPDVLDKPELQVLSGGQQVVNPPNALWRSDLGSEIRVAVLATVLRDSRLALLPAVSAAGNRPVNMLQLAVDRMEMATGQYARLEVTWSLQRPLAGGALPAPVVCRARWERAVAGTALADAVAVQQALMRAWGLRIQRQVLGQGEDACGG